METLCGFLNGNGGRVLFGVLADGRIVGQTISDATIRDVTAELIKLDPPATILSERIPVADSRDGPAGFLPSAF